jgi:hypothetical protein
MVPLPEQMGSGSSPGTADPFPAQRWLASTASPSFIAARSHYEMRSIRGYRDTVLVVVLLPVKVFLFSATTRQQECLVFILCIRTK